MNWDALISVPAIAAVVPDAYARFRPAVRGALAVFLEGLPAARQSAIVREQDLDMIVADLLNLDADLAFRGMRKGVGH